MSEAKLEHLLETWGKNYKKGVLTFWMLLLLHNQEAYAFEMSKIVHELSQGSIQVDDNSIYRALNRFKKMGIVESSWKESNQGPKRRYYRLSGLGNDLLKLFIQQNILVFQSETVAARIQAVINKKEQ